MPRSKKVKICPRCYDTGLYAGKIYCHCDRKTRKPLGYIFDVDGTICDRDSTTLYPHFVSWLQSANKHWRVAFASNQGGVGCRLMLGDETADKIGLPTKTQVDERMATIKTAVEDILGREVIFNYCYAYQDKIGVWAPTPLGSEKDMRWSRIWRKPSSGMVHNITHQWLTLQMNGRILMIGDREEDRLAAKSGVVSYMHPDGFFKL